MTVKNYNGLFVLLGAFILLISLVDLSIGAIKIDFIEVVKTLFTQSGNPNFEYIIIQYRLPKIITAIITGSGLGISGLLMQTYFKNPLSGPFVLGISSGASLGVALLILGSSSLGIIGLNTVGIPLAASIGAFTVLSIVMLTARNIKNTFSILIIGLMFGSFTTAIISILSYFSNANDLQQFIFWSLGSLNNLSWHEVYILMTICCLCYIGLFFLCKPLNALLLGENYALSIGTNLKKTRLITFLITSLLTGIITAFTGPIAFVGLAIPHVTKLLFKTSNHNILLPAVILIGALLLLVCDILTQFTVNNQNLPINAITSLFGAPIVIGLLIKKTT